MLDSFGESRLRTLGLGKGIPEALKELGQLTGYLRHHLSSALIWANVRCLLLVGEGIGQAGRRRQWARQEEEKARWRAEEEARLKAVEEARLKAIKGNEDAAERKGTKPWGRR